MQRCAAAAAGRALSALGSRGPRPDSLGGLAAVWQQAAQAVEAFLHPPSASLACPRGVCTTSAAAAAASSEPQRAEEEEERPAAAAAQGAAAVAGGPAAGARAVRHCWQCGAGLRAADMFFCPDCNSIQPPDPDAESKYFDVFGLAPGQFEVEQGALEQRYKQLQRLLHPDKYSVSSDLEKEYSDHQAALVNQAYEVLKKPLRRAHYILQQRGLGACEGLTITDPELLMYVMEAREEVEATADPARLRQLLDQSLDHEEKCVQELSEAFQRGDLAHAAEVTTQLRYVKRIQEAIVDKL